MTTKFYTSYNTTTGRVVGVTNVNSDLVEAVAPQGCVLVEGNYPARDWYYDLNDSQFKQRIDSGIVLDKELIAVSEVATLSNIPNPSTVVVDGVGPVTVTDGVLTITGDAIGVFGITFNELEYKSHYFELEVE